MLFCTINRKSDSILYCHLLFVHYAPLYNPAIPWLFSIATSSPRDIILIMSGRSYIHTQIRNIYYIRIVRKINICRKEKRISEKNLQVLVNERKIGNTTTPSQVLFSKAVRSIPVICKQRQLKKEEPRGTI